MNGRNVAFAVAGKYQGPGIFPLCIVAYPAFGCFVFAPYKMVRKLLEFAMLEVALMITYLPRMMTKQKIRNRFEDFFVSFWPQDFWPRYHGAGEIFPKSF